jgi:hypothetical protein
VVCGRVLIPAISESLASSLVLVEQIEEVLSRGLHEGIVLPAPLVQVASSGERPC